MFNQSNYDKTVYQLHHGIYKPDASENKTNMVKVERLDYKFVIISVVVWKVFESLRKTILLSKHLLQTLDQVDNMSYIYWK